LSDPDDPRIGNLVAKGRYRVDSVLGRGGMGTVYLVEVVRDSTRAAMKVLAAEHAGIPELVARFEREASIGRRIEHPNAAIILDSGALEDGALYLVMELLEGPSLAELVAVGRVPVARAVAACIDVLSALEAAHKLGITHRDIKPDNVMLVAREGKERAKLVDFGIASNDRAAFKLTVAGVAFGTPQYLSPEMAMGLAVDHRADVYSLGITLFQLVTGKLPFVVRETKLLLHAHAHEAPPSPRTVAPDAHISDALDAAILRAIEKLPEQRFQSAAEMRDALRAVAAEPPWWRAWVIALLIVIAIAGTAWLVLIPRGVAPGGAGVGSEHSGDAPRPAAAKKRKGGSR
jgi:serine/threonine-protein kinase